MKRNMTLTALSAGLLLSFGACAPSGTEESTTQTTFAVTAECKQAQDDCQGKAKALVEKAKGQAETCATQVRAACEGAQASDACAKARDACKGGIEAQHKEIEGLRLSCGAQVKTACGETKGTPRGATDGGDRSECKAAAEACQKSGNALGDAQRDRAEACRASIEKACGDMTPGQAPSDACKAAFAGCQAGAEAAGKDAAGLGKACHEDIAKVCAVPHRAGAPVGGGRPDGVRPDGGRPEGIRPDGGRPSFPPAGMMPPAPPAGNEACRKAIEACQNSGGPGTQGPVQTAVETCAQDVAKACRPTQPGTAPGEACAKAREACEKKVSEAQKGASDKADACRASIDTACR